MRASRGSRAHPRSRGENEAEAQRLPDGVGSSPLTRGKLRANRVPKTRVGLIPAHAGKTSGRRSWLSRGGAHPRSRGENVVRPGATILEPGSSPLTRGKLHQLRHRFATVGLIPAHAGKTSIRCTTSGDIGAHPRSRGENHRLTSGLEDAGGSSPLTRGKPIHCPQTRPCPRLIPAHAGKTLTRPLMVAGMGAHPRSRGENIAARV